MRNTRRVYINNKNVYQEGKELSGRDNEWKNLTITTKTWKEKEIRGRIGGVCSEGTMHRRLILFKHFIKLLTKFVAYPLGYSHTNLCSFLSATECSCNLYRITRNLRPLSESSVKFPR